MDLPDQRHSANILSKPAGHTDDALFSRHDTSSSSISPFSSSLGADDLPGWAELHSNLSSAMSCVLKNFCWTLFVDKGFLVLCYGYSTLASIQQPASVRCHLLMLDSLQRQFGSYIGPRDHVTLTLILFRWLPVCQRIRYKLCTMIHSVYDGQAPWYVTDIVTPVTLSSNPALQLQYPIYPTVPTWVQHKMSTTTIHVHLLASVGARSLSPGTVFLGWLDASSCLPPSSIVSQAYDVSLYISDD